jgi:AraC-like DNA-binding protein
VSSAEAPDSSGVIRLSSEALPKRDRLAAWREFYGRKFLRLEHMPLSDGSFRVDLALRPLPGLGIVKADLSPLRVGRTRELVTDGNDGVTFQISSTAGMASQLGREVEVSAGAAIGMSNADLGTFDFPLGSHTRALSLSRRTLATLVRHLDDMLVREVPNETEALWLLKQYLEIFDGAPALAAPNVIELAVTHVYDLAALSLGATRDAAEVASGRGVRAARLAAAKTYVRQHLHRQDLRAGAVAAHLRVTPRYVHRLFESDGVSFLEYVLAERLALAHRILLTDHSRTISAIALAVGFSDLSHFNRTFRRRFGRTPTDVRAEAQRGSDGE